MPPRRCAAGPQRAGTLRGAPRRRPCRLHRPHPGPGHGARRRRGRRLVAQPAYRTASQNNPSPASPHAPNHSGAGQRSDGFAAAQEAPPSGTARRLRPSWKSAASSATPVLMRLASSKLGAPEGLERGASKDKVYEGTRIQGDHTLTPVCRRRPHRAMASARLHAGACGYRRAHPPPAACWRACWHSRRATRNPTQARWAARSTSDWTASKAARHHRKWTPLSATTRSGACPTVFPPCPATKCRCCSAGWTRAHRWTRPCPAAKRHPAPGEPVGDVPERHQPQGTPGGALPVRTPVPGAPAFPGGDRAAVLSWCAPAPARNRRWCPGRAAPPTILVPPRSTTGSNASAKAWSTRTTCPLPWGHSAWRTGADSCWRRPVRATPARLQRRRSQQPVCGVPGHFRPPRATAFCWTRPEFFVMGFIKDRFAAVRWP